MSLMKRLMCVLDPIGFILVVIVRSMIFVVDFEKRQHHLMHHNKHVYPCFYLDGKIFRSCHKTFRCLPLVLYAYSLHDFRVMNCLNRLNKGLNLIRRELQH